MAKVAASIGVLAVIALVLALVLNRPAGQGGSVVPASPIDSRPLSSTPVSSATSPTPKPSALPQSLLYEPSSAPSASVAQPSPPFDVVSDGDQVTAAGYLLQTKPGTVTLCRSPVFFAIGMGPAGCGVEDIVRVIGLDARAFPGERREDQWLSTYLRVRGNWTGGAVQAIGADLADRPAFVRWTVPCPTPFGGWPGNSGSEQQKRKEAALEDAVAAHLDVYTGVWSGYIGDSQETATVVGAVGDLAIATHDLAAIYRYNLCVTPVQHSLDELLAVVDALEAAPIQWNVGADNRNDRVTVTMPVLEQVAADALAPYADQIMLTTTVVRSP